MLRLPLLSAYYLTVYEACVIGLEVALAALLPPLFQPFFEEIGLKKSISRPSPEVINGGILLLSLVF